MSHRFTKTTLICAHIVGLCPLCAVTQILDAMSKRLVFLTGAGMSVDSGFSTFRDAGGLWEKYSIDEICTVEGWLHDPVKVNTFYNGLRRQLVAASPNAGHEMVADFERDYDVDVITQNVDDLHERAGSSRVLHLHGELMKVCSSRDKENPYHLHALTPPDLDVLPGQKAGDGSLLRPYIVFFGEAVPNLEAAARLVESADIFVIIGSSLVVYPAAGLVNYVRPNVPIYLIDPKEVGVPGNIEVNVIRDTATRGLQTLRQLL